MLHFNVLSLDSSWRIDEIQWAELPYKRPRSAGKNARLDTHGWGGDVPIARIKIGGVSGFGWCTLSKESAAKLVGHSARSLFTEDGMLREDYLGLEFPLLDWLGSLTGMPVFRLVARDGFSPAVGNYNVPVYDTSIYFDELDIQDDDEAIAFMLKEVESGLDNGHKNFKVKIGRCGMWMPIDKGLKRDIDLVLAIRKLIGADGKLMVDANNGYNLNLTKTFLHETASAKLHWLEEAFHEDDRLYANLKDWMKNEGVNTLIADGEGYASSAIVDWAKKGLVDVLQYDLRAYGFFRWMLLGNEMDRHGILSAPHNYGGFYGNFAQTHFAASIKNFAFAEWDQAEAEGVDTSAYAIENGVILVPEKSGFGLSLNNDVFEDYSRKNGWKAAL